MIPDNTHFQIRLASSRQDLRAAQRLRYRVFVEELGGGGASADHEGRLERDEFDEVNDHLILVDTHRDPTGLDYVIGAYRLLKDDKAAEFGRFYCDSEYDLTQLRQSGRKLLELGRSCVATEFRGSAAMFLLWNGLAEYVLENGIEILFGVASFHGTDVGPLKMPLSWLYHRHLAPEALRVRAHAAHYRRMDLVAEDQLDRHSAMLAMPALIKAYLRLGGFVGDGAYVDHEFNTTDVCLVMDTAAMSARHKGFYTRKHGVKA